MTEIEVKVKIDNPASVRSRLLALGAEETAPRHLERNILFDFRDGRLAGRREALRVRRARRRAVLTYKGPPLPSRKFKIREEYEIETRKAAPLLRILRALGMVPVLHYDKHRTVFRKGALTICLDETKAGFFVEFEGDRADIARMAESLQMPKKDWIRKDYPTLLHEAGIL